MAPKPESQISHLPKRGQSGRAAHSSLPRHGPARAPATSAARPRRHTSASRFSPRHTPRGRVESTYVVKEYWISSPEGDWRQPLASSARARRLQPRGARSWRPPHRRSRCERPARVLHGGGALGPDCCHHERAARSRCVAEPAAAAGGVVAGLLVRLPRGGLRACVSLFLSMGIKTLDGERRAGAPPRLSAHRDL